MITKNKAEYGPFMKYLKALAIITLLIVLYLFALNGRFSHVKDWAMFDKWKQEWIVPSDESFIEK